MIKCTPASTAGSRDRHISISVSLTIGLYRQVGEYLRLGGAPFENALLPILWKINFIYYNIPSIKNRHR